MMGNTLKSARGTMITIVPRFTSPCNHQVTGYNFRMQRSYFSIVLVLLQVFIATLGQGAFTLCVRRDGTQALEWTATSDCQSLTSVCHAACGHSLCDEAIDEDGVELRCDPCTDYLLVAVVVAVVDLKPVHLLEGTDDLCWYLPVAGDEYALHLTVLMSHPPPIALWESLADLGASVVLRC